MDAAPAPAVHEERAEPRAHPVLREPGRELSPREREILDFEQKWWKQAGAKDQSIRGVFDLSATRYYQILNTLIDRDEAVAHAPMLVRRLRRIRQARRGASSSRLL